MTISKSDILSSAKRQLKTQIKWRRHLHQYPEISNNEYKTTAYLKNELNKLGLKIIPIKYPTGIIAELKGGNTKPVIAIRCDIDALPIQEMTNLSYKSKNNGAMHGCGHDVHATVVLGTAKLLSRYKNNLPGSVRFIFQPAEESPPGGAIPMINNHALKDVKLILSLHVDPTLTTGKISLRDGETMASVYDFDIIVHGKGGHAAVPHRTIDPVLVAAEIVTRVQSIVSRETSPLKPIVISFGQIHGGTARNIIPDTVVLSGTSRALSGSIAKRLPEMIRRGVNGICQSHGAHFEIRETGRYPLLINNEKANLLLRNSWESLFGKHGIEETEITMGGEDFASYLQKVPGAMFRLGIKNKKIGAVHPWHSPLFNVDENAIFFGTALLTKSVVDYFDRY